MRDLTPRLRRARARFSEKINSGQTHRPWKVLSWSAIAWPRMVAMPSVSLRPLLWLLCVVFCGASARAQNPPASLAAQVHAIAAEHHGDIALCAENLKTHETVTISPDTPVQTASVIKLAILYEALEQVRSGKAHFDDKITLTKADQVQGSGVLLFFDAPLSLTLKDVLTVMIVMSDNSATNLVIDHLGLENIDARIAKLGLKDTDDAKLCQVALKMLHVQFYRSAIPRYLEGMPGATSDSIANKTGSLDAVRNDVAAISTKNGMVVISVFTFNNKDRSWGAEQEGELTIAKLARAIIQSWSPEGLAAWPGSPGKDMAAGK